MSDWLSFEQVLGYVASIVLLAGYAVKQDRKTKTILIASSVIFAAHFFLLGAFTASAICAVNSVRNFLSVFLYQSKITFSIFTIFYAVGAYFTYNTPIDILPSLAAFLTCIGMFFLGGIRFRILVVIATVMWIVHNIVVGSIGGTINSVILFFITLGTVWRLYQDKKNA